MSALALPVADAKNPDSDGLLFPESRAATGGPAWRTWLGVIGALVAVYFFIAAIHLMGHGLKTMAGVPSAKLIMDNIFHLTDHPLAGLSVGVLLTSIVQSSSFTTSFVVGLVAANQISLAAAIPIIMGANIGTSVTNILVSLAHLRHRIEFRRSLGGAVVHDLFNVLSVSLLMPLEWKFHIVSGPARAFADWLGTKAFFTTDPRKFNLVKKAVKPLEQAGDWLLGSVLHLGQVTCGLIIAAAAVVMLFAALFYLVKILRGMLKDRLAGLFSRTLFSRQPVSFVVGLFTTSVVQSSSVTTSLIVPLVGAGVLKIRQIFPYTLGANIGTTVTALLGGLAIAATAAGQGQAVQTAAAFGLAVAVGHLLFNIYGTVVFWPLQWIPISLAKGFAGLAARRRILAAVYIIVIFFLVPILTIVLVNRQGLAKLIGVISGHGGSP
ncbi:MAG: Na/Pi symporter [Planctomycetes bacterium]|nr:Na/Pi symporter [Planctomycetota bacterium]